MAGWLEKRALLSFETLKVSACADSLAGPLLIAVAQLFTVWAPSSSSIVSSAPFVKEGTSLTEFTFTVIV